VNQGEPQAVPKRAAHAAFEIGIIFKGVDGVLEIAGAALLWLVRPEQLHRVVALLTQHELSEDPRDLIARALAQGVEHLTGGGRGFAAVYLLSHGVLKVWLVWALLKKKLWAYPVAILVFVGFGVYQMYRYAYSHSAAMLALTVLDVFVIALTFVEYRRLRTS
jgi:uncharacterized membrane protein